MPGSPVNEKEWRQFTCEIFSKDSEIQPANKCHRRMKVISRTQ